MSNRSSHLHLSDLDGLARLGVHGVVTVADLVEHMHHVILRPPGIRTVSAETRTSGITGLVYQSIRSVTGLVGGALVLTLGTAARFGGGGSTPERDRMLAALNGVLGDYLDQTGNPLATTMCFRRDGRTIPDDATLAKALPEAGDSLLVFIHGLCLDEHCWRPEPGDGGPDRRCLPEDTAGRGWTVLHLRYNTGRPIHANGRDFAEALQKLVEHWPVALERIAIVGHSVGGLVARSAAHQALETGHAWTRLLRQLVFLGTPHHGSPLARAGAGIDRVLGVSRYTAPFTRLGQMCSAGITDLRHGNLLAGAGTASARIGHTGDTRTPTRLPQQTQCFAVAATLDKNPQSARSRYLGDGLVPVPSALGQHRNPALHLAIEPHRFHIATSTGHQEIMYQPEVVGRVLRWLE